MLFVVGLGLIQGGNESDSRQERGGAAKYGLPTLCFVYLTTHPQYGTILRKVFDLNITQVKNRRGSPPPKCNMAILHILSFFAFSVSARN